MLNQPAQRRSCLSHLFVADSAISDRWYILGKIFFAVYLVALFDFFWVLLGGSCFERFSHAVLISSSSFQGIGQFDELLYMTVTRPQVLDREAENSYFSLHAWPIVRLYRYFGHDFRRCNVVWWYGLICWWTLSEWRITITVTKRSRCWTFETSMHFFICFFCEMMVKPKVTTTIGTILEIFCWFHWRKNAKCWNNSKFWLIKQFRRRWIYGTSKGSFWLEALVLRKQFLVLMGTGASAGKKERRRHRHADEELKPGLCVFACFFGKQRWWHMLLLHFFGLVRHFFSAKKGNLLKWEHVPCIEK